MSRTTKFIALLLSLVAGSSRADTSVVFNEIMYHPLTNEPVMEWVELYNQMAVDVDVSGWAMDGAVTYSFPSNTIVRGGGFLVVAVSPGTLMAATGLTNVLGPFLGRLSNSGETLQLRNNSGRVVDEVSYGVDGNWPVAPDGSGVSLAKIDHDTASGPASNWSISDQVGGTPGTENFPGQDSIPVQVFAMDTTWKFNASGVDLGSAWSQPGYADGAWAAGKAWLYCGTVTNGTVQPVATLFNTGVDASGAVLAPGATDPHFILTAAAQGPVNTNATVCSNHPAWVANDTASSWISVVSSGLTSINAGGFNYATRFSLNGFIPASVQIQANIAVDDNLSDILLNGTSLGISCSGYSAYNGPFALNGAALPGTNTLEFRTVNGGGPGGFRATFTSSGTFVMTNTLLPAGPATCYLRKTFTWSGDPASTLLRLNAILADGAVFYLNGVEVQRLNMPTGAVAYSTPALTNAANPIYSGFFTISAASLSQGDNVLAVEVHRASGNTNRTLFGAELTAQPTRTSSALVFNEVSAGTNTAFWVELMNRGTNLIPLSGDVIALVGSGTNEYVFPVGTSLAPDAFLTLTNDVLGFQPALGDRLFLFRAGKTGVYDSVAVKPALRGRFPDGTGPWLAPNAPTPGRTNSFSFHREVVINEIMYHHRDLPPTNGVPAQNSPESWIELYNRSATAVDLTAWSLGGGISYAFPDGQILPAGAYLVVAKDAAYLRSLYPSITILGDFGNNLSHSSDTVVLYDAAGNPANQVRYFNDGRWPAYAAGGGSSLELRDPNADNSKAEAWAASDETGRSSWQTYRYQAVAQTRVGPELWNDFILGFLGDGECLIDDISVVQSPTSGPVQCIANGNFEAGLAGWRLLGDHRLSRVEVDPDNPANHVLHVIADGPQEHMHNHIETTFANGRTVVNGQTYEISFRAKWMAGNNLLNTRLYFDRVARTTPLPVPALSGTPGARNSRYTANLGPTFSSFQHHAVVPQPGEAVAVSVAAQDPNGISACEVWWSTNGGAFAHTAMALQSSGLYAGTIPGYAAGTIVQFYVRATDGLGMATTYPAAGPNSGALYVVADGQADLALAHNVRIILTPANRALLHALTNVMSNENLPCTVIYDEQRPYYDMGVRLKGSERGRYSDTRVSFHLEFQPDDLFRGVHPVMLIDRSGAGDATYNKQEEIVIRHMLLRAGNIPGTQPDMCRVIAPFTTHTGPAIFAPRHEDEFVETAYANGGSGNEWELELTYYPMTTNQFGYKLPQPDNVVGVDISDLGTDKEIYRYDFILKNHRDADDYSRFLTFAKTFSLPSGSTLDLETRQVMDVDEWLRAFALVSLCGVGDSYTFGNNHNLLIYERPADQKMLAFPWDMDFAFYQSPTTPLIGDQNWGKIENLPANRRRIYAHALDIIRTAFNTSYTTYWVAHYARFAPGQDYSGALSYIQQRTAGILSEINNSGGNSAFSVSGAASFTTTNNLVTLSGTASVQVQSILINGIAYPVTWTSVSGWTTRLPVVVGTNVLHLAGCDLYGSPLTNFTGTVTVYYSGAVPDPAGTIVFNEIMYNPVVPGAAYVELFNTSPSVSFDLSNWQVHGLGYTFPPGSIITNRQFLVLAKDPATFTTTYGTSTWAFDAYPGTLQTNGETLSLLRPDFTGTNYLVVAKVRYEGAPPWPAAQPGTSLQLSDASRDNWRPGNWAIASGSLARATPGAPNSTAAGLEAFPPLWLNELQPDNLTGITNSAGQRTAWLEIYTPSANAVSLNGLYLANNYTNLTQWVFPTNAAISPGQFRVVFADGQTSLSTTGELHTSFVLPSGSGSLALTRLATNGQFQVLDYINYTNLAVNQSYGSFPDGQSFIRQTFFHATPGATNDGISIPPPSFIAYATAGAVYTQNFDSLPDPGAVSVNTANPVTINGVTYSLANPFDFASPPIANGSVGGLGLPALAGWFGMADPAASVGTRFGATDGDQTTGGVLSFGLPNSSNRALGLLATSTTGYNAFGARFINQTPYTLNSITLQFTAEVWRQSDKPKTLQFYYFIDPTAAAPFSTSFTAFLPSLNVSFPTVPSDVGGVAVDGTAPANQMSLGVTNQVITNWPPGAALWLVWEMADATGKAQGLGIDNLSFSASVWPGGELSPSLTAQLAGTNLLISCPTIAGLRYQVEYTTNLTAASWTPLGNPQPGTGALLIFTNTPTALPQGYYRLKVLP
jgi:hypothetical protein